jgi:cyclopropane-fatty-acyl-phospholipid synthase
MSAATGASSALPQRLPASARSALHLLQSLRHGSLDVQLPDGTRLRAGSGDEPRAALRLHDWQPCAAALRSGDIGVAQSYIAGHWSTPDLSALLRLLVTNREALEALVYGRWWGALLYRAMHWLNRNSRSGSRHNVHAHYDLGNAFYRLWLDESMSYSSAWFADGDRSRPLAEAQAAKLRRALRECAVRPGQRLLEIGCGWGALAECAARDVGARVTGITLSREQLAYARQRLRDAGLAERAELRLQDYRELGDEPYDAIVCIEMFEAVGHAYWPAFFATLRRQLKPGARACLQSIVIRDDLFARYLRSTDFIQQYIFPGGLLPSAAIFREHAQRAGFALVSELAFGPDYAETLRRWRAAFVAQERALRELGLDTRFLRLWDFYLAYCEAAFAAGNTDVVQFTLERRG